MKGAKHGEYNANFYTSNTTGVKQPADDRYAPIASLKLQLNGADRFSERKGSYFSQVEPFAYMDAKPAAGIYCYNFGLKPEETQPSGTCNFSRIDNATLIVTTKACPATADVLANVTDENTTFANVAGNLTNLLCFAQNFNVLRIMSGMGGLAYAN